VTFDEVLEQALEMLRRRGRVSYRAFKAQFHLDDDLLEILKEEIVAVHQLGRDQEGTMLVWTGDTVPAAVPVSHPTPDPVRAPLTYTPPYLAEKIFTSRTSLEGERKQVTVLFADLKGSMELLAERDPEEARTLLDQALEHMATGSRFYYHAHVLIELCEALLRVSRVEDAGILASHLLDLSRTHTGRGYQAHAYRLLGEVARHREPPDVDQATVHYRQSLVLAEDLGMYPLQAHCHLGLGTLYTQAGQWQQAQAELSAAIDLYRAMDMLFWLPQAEER
jgi:tetratricopeptide (TPR) repeat protein